MPAEPINDPDTPADPRAADRRRGSLLHAVMLAVNAGYFVFPVRPGGKEPALDKEWEGQATRDRVTVRRWWRRTPHNPLTGPSGVVVDLDDGHGATAPEPFAGARNGLEVLTRLAARAGAEVPTDTFTVLTPSVIHGNPAWCQHCLPRPEPVAVDVVKSELSTGAQQRDVATAAWRSVFRLARRMGGGER